MENSNEIVKHILSIIVRHQAGVMSHVSGLFTRRGFNIESVAVGETHDPRQAVITIVMLGSLKDAEQFHQQLLKLADVLAVRRLPYHDSLLRELLLIRVKSKKEERSSIFGIVEVFGGKIVEVSLDNMLIEVHGNPRRISGFISMMKDFGILEIARTGQVALSYSYDFKKNEP